MIQNDSSGAFSFSKISSWRRPQRRTPGPGHIDSQSHATTTAVDEAMLRWIVGAVCMVALMTLLANFVFATFRAEHSDKYHDDLLYKKVSV